MASTQKCSGCATNHPLTRDYFGSTPSGGFRTKCRKCMAAHTKAYQGTHPEQRAATDMERITRGGNILLNERQKQNLITKQKGYCLCCGTKIEIGQSIEVDHIKPLAKGGTHDQKNLAIAHTKCNTEKHAKTLDEHWAWRAKLGLPVKKFKLLFDGTWIAVP